MKKKFTKKLKSLFTTSTQKKPAPPKTQAAPVLTRKVSFLCRKHHPQPGTNEIAYGFSHQLMSSRNDKANSYPVGIKHVLKITQVSLLTVLSVICSVVWLLLLPEASTKAARYLALLEGRIPENQAMEMGGVAGVETAPKVIIESLNLPEPELSATGVVAEDLESGQILYQKNIHQHLLPASTTKLMTALVALDYYKMTDILTVKPESLAGGSTMGLVLGEKLTFRSLLYGILLNSGNDAAFTIAANYPGGVEAFVKQMNVRAQSLGLVDTHFQNPAGFDDPAHYSSAYDLARIGREVADSPVLAQIVDTKQTVVDSIGDKKIHVLKNVDELLSVAGVIGIKTGYTDEAGENFVGLVDREGKEVLTVVLDSKDRFGETKMLIDWVYQNYRWVNQ